MDYIETESDSGPRSLCSKLWHFFEAREIKVPGLPLKDSHNLFEAMSILMGSHTS
jgi:hypothetical protein